MKYPTRFFVFVVSLIALFAITRAHAAPLKVRVRGAAKLTARASRELTGAGTSELVLSGSLTDDIGAPLPVRKVTIRVVREAAPDDDGVAAALQHPRGCDNAGRGPTAWAVQPSGRNEILVTTDEEGRFCLRAPLAGPDRYRATLIYVPGATDTLVDGAVREIAFDLSRRGLSLRFDPTPRVLQLDAPRTVVEAVALLDDDATPRVATGVTIVLANETKDVATAVTDTSGRARFELAGDKLGPPGPGELRVRFAGDTVTADASHAEEVERHVKVTLKVPAAERGELKPGVPEDGIPLAVDVATMAGPLGEGSVEARIGDIVVGTAPVERGLARLTLTFGSEGSEALVRLRYVPTSPWYEALTEPTVRIPIHEPSLLTKAPILVAGIAVLALFLVGRVSGQQNKPAPPAPGPAESAGTPGIEVVRAADSANEGWAGRVVDAHEGTPIAGARVWIERGTFEGRSMLASAETDAGGRFELPSGIEITGNEILSAEARLHARFRRELPPPGELAIALAERRRALLARLVEWARRRGAPFDARPEPTPGHVRRAASGEAGTVRWADAVEEAAFGPAEVDARAEEAVERLHPDDAKKRG